MRTDQGLTLTMHAPESAVPFGMNIEPHVGDEVQKRS